MNFCIFRPADLVTFTEEILDGKLFLCALMKPFYRYIGRKTNSFPYSCDINVSFETALLQIRETINFLPI